MKKPISLGVLLTWFEPIFALGVANYCTSSSIANLGVIGFSEPIAISPKYVIFDPSLFSSSFSPKMLSFSHCVVDFVSHH